MFIDAIESWFRKKENSEVTAVRGFLVHRFSGSLLLKILKMSSHSHDVSVQIYIWGEKDEHSYHEMSSS